MNKVRQTRSKITESYDSDGVLTGVEVEKILNVPVTPETFTMMYNDYMGKLYGITHFSDRKLLDKFCEIAEFNTGMIRITTQDRNDICEQLGISKPNLSKNISRLKDASLITGDKGVYYINPALFWKGDRKVRAEILKKDALRVIVEFKSSDDILCKE